MCGRRGGGVIGEGSFGGVWVLRGVGNFFLEGFFLVFGDERVLGGGRCGMGCGGLGSWLWGEFAVLM